MSGTNGTMPLSERSDHGRMTDTNPADPTITIWEGLVAKNRHQLKVPKHATPINDNGHKGAIVAPRSIPYRTKPIQTPSTKNHSSDSGEGMAINEGPTAYHEFQKRKNKRDNSFSN